MQASVTDLTVARAGFHSDGTMTLEDESLVAGGRDLPRNCQPNDTRADDHAFN
jgi:hypothetical protein